MPIGALFAVFSLLLSRSAAMRPCDILLLFGLGFHLIVFLIATRRRFAEGHSATSNYLIDVHVQNV